MYSAASNEKRSEVAASTITLKARIVVPMRMEKRLTKMTERMSVPPDDPLDLNIIPNPIPVMIPARRALRILSWTGRGTWITAIAAEKITIPTML